MKYANNGQQQENLLSWKDTEQLQVEVVEGLLKIVEEACELPFVAICLKKEKKQWTNTREYLFNTEASVLHHFYPLDSDEHEKVIVEDILSDQRNVRLSQHPFVSPFRFLARLPFYSKGGDWIGDLLAGDTKARKLSHSQLSTLEVVSGQVGHLLELQHQFVEGQKNWLEGQKVLSTKEGYLNMLSHELRTPLHGIIGMSSLLGQHQAPARQQELMEALKFSAESLISLINDLLDESRLKAGKLQTEQKEFFLEELLRNLCNSMKTMVGPKEIDLQLDLQPKLPIIEGDPLRLSQVLWNLLSNALKFTEKGCVRLEVRTVMETDHLVSLQFLVQDTGPGIPVDMQEKIFEEFAQLTTHKPSMYGGSGLGLTITRKLLQLMGSDISVQSKEGEGAFFSFCLSFKKSSELPVTERIKESPPALAGEKSLSQKKVLLADDNRVNQLVTGKMLEQWGMLVEMASNGKEAVQMAAEKEYDIILMDLQMPCMDGLSATRLIRSQNCHNSTIPVFALTASAAPFLEQEVQKCGINDCLMKPFKPEKLYNLMYKSLEGEEPVPQGNPLQEKVDGIVKGDAGFKKQLLQLYVKSFREIMGDLKEGRLQDAVYLRSLRHKHKPSFKMLGLSAMEISLEKLQHELDTSAQESEAAIKEHFLAIESLGKQVLSDLEAVV